MILTFFFLRCDIICKIILSQTRCRALRRRAGSPVGTPLLPLPVQRPRLLESFISRDIALINPRPRYLINRRWPMSKSAIIFALTIIFKEIKWKIYKYFWLYFKDDIPEIPANKLWCYYYSFIYYMYDKFTWFQWAFWNCLNQKYSMFY